MRGYLYPPAYVLSPVRRTTTTDSLALAARAANYSPKSKPANPAKINPQRPKIRSQPSAGVSVERYGDLTTIR